MTERLRSGSKFKGDSKAMSQSSDEGLSTKKTMLVLVVVVGCFAVLWPKLFYPMLVSNANSHIKPGPVDKTTGCCDVISELDVDTIKIMSELCGTIIDHAGKSPPTPQEIVIQCRKAVLETCGIDISAALKDRISLGHSAKQILEEVRSLNGSLCLKYNFGVAPWKLGVPHRVNVNVDPVNSIRQERSSHMRPGMIHPAFRERGRAIPEADTSGTPRRTAPPPRIVEGRPGPIPGMRPAMGGAGHVVPPSKQTNYGFMGVLMPLYTVGFVLFFSYTIMKLVFKKKPEAYVGAPLYPPCDPDEQFHKEVFEANKHYFNRPNKETSKIVDDELDQLRKRLRETELAMERIVHQMAQAPLASQDEIRPNGSLPKEDDQGSVTVMGMETTASCESGKKWSRPDSPVLPHPQPAPPKEPSPPPQKIFLEGALPPLSQILVADSATEASKDPEDDSPVVLAGKMTLSVISLDSETGTEDSSNSGKKVSISDEERRRSSSNISEEFEKINAADLEDQINDIIEEAENIALAEENRTEEDLEKLLEQELPQAPQINEKEPDSDILEEIKNQFNLEDDLLQALKESEPQRKVALPVTDIIKEFLNNEEAILLQENTDETSDISIEVVAEPENRDDKEILENQNLDKGGQEIEGQSDRAETIESQNESEEAEAEKLAEENSKLEEQLTEEILEAEVNSSIIEASTQENKETEEPGEEHIPIPSEPTEPEEISVKTTADVLLQGLLVKEDNNKPEPIELLSSEQPTDDVQPRTPEVSLKEDTPALPEQDQQHKEATEKEDAISGDDHPPGAIDVEEQVIEDIEYNDESGNEDLDEDELREVAGENFEDRESVERRVNGDDAHSLGNGAGNSETAAENEISEDELENEDDEEIEEIIEYVDNTDDEGEEIIEINGNEHRHLNENGAN